MRVVWQLLALNRTAITRGLLVAAIAAPAIFTLQLIDRYGVNVPFGDDFTLVPVYAAAHARQLTVQQLFAQHNEHRIAVPRVLAIALTRLFPGDMRAAMFFSWILCLLTAIALWRPILQSVGGDRSGALGAMAIASMILFSPVQAENWLWAFQFAAFLVNLLFVAAVVVAFSNCKLWLRFVLTATLAIATTFSFGNGALVWLLSFPLALLRADAMSRQQRFCWAVSWIALAGCTLIAYFTGYTRPADSPPLFPPRAAIDYVSYVLTLLGSGVVRAANVRQPAAPALAGAVLLLAFFAAAWRVLIRSRAWPLRDMVGLYFALGAYALLTACLTAVSRVGFGTWQATSSRYTTFSLYFVLAVVGLVMTSRQQRCRTPASLRWLISAGFIVGFAVLLWPSYRWGIESMRRVEFARREGKAALLVANIVDSSAIYARRLDVDPAAGRHYANILNDLGLFHPRLLRSAAVSSVRSVSAEQEISGYIESVRKTDDGYEASGWGFLPSRSRPADAVLLSRGVGANQTLVAIAEREQRPDVARSLRNPELMLTGWRAKITTKEPGEQIEAWAFDSIRATLHELRNAAPVR